MSKESPWGNEERADRSHSTAQKLKRKSKQKSYVDEIVTGERESSLRAQEPFDT